MADYSCYQAQSLRDLINSSRQVVKGLKSHVERKNALIRMHEKAIEEAEAELARRKEQEPKEGRDGHQANIL
jgi:hypothetical protein